MQATTLRIYHTLWTKPLLPERVEVTRLCYAISFHFAKQMNAQVVLHTDDCGKQLLAHIPYDEVITDLNHIPENISRFWAYGKLVATQNEPLCSVHIDGDVFLKNPKLKDYFCHPHDLLVQSEENDKWRTDYTYELTQTAIGITDLPHNLSLFYPLAYNCGVTQFCNNQLKQTYLDAYFRTVQQSLNDPTYSKRVEKILNKYPNKGSIIPDIVPEQQFLHQLSHNYNVQTILQGNIHKDAIRKGYTHLCSAVKYTMKSQLQKLLSTLNNTQL